MKTAQPIEKVRLNRVKPGEYVRLSDKPNAKTYKRGHYDREWKSFSLSDVNDANAEIFRKSTTLVFIGFTF